MSVRSLSDKVILSRVCELTKRERSVTLQVLLHLNEIERRKLHLKLGYASMFAYCTSGLGYSASAAVRRLRTARWRRAPATERAGHRANTVTASTGDAGMRSAGDAGRQPARGRDYDRSGRMRTNTGSRRVSLGVTVP